METNGTTRAEMETMEAIQSLAMTAEAIQKELQTQNKLLTQLVTFIQNGLEKRLG